MDKLWKGIMHLNAKAFCVLAFFLLAGTTVWCGLRFLTPPEPFKEGTGSSGKPEDPITLTTLEFVSNQVADTALIVPIDPFRPTIEAIFTNETERAAFLRALKAAQAAAAGVTPAGGGAGGVTAVGPNGVAANGGAGGGAAGGAGKADPFAELRKKSQVPGVTTGVNGQKMITPEIAFLGFIERPDGSRAALFSDSTDKSTFFYEPGKQVHGVDILSANVREASIRFPDGTTKNVAIGNKLTLAAEPLKTPTAAPKTADAKAAAPNAKGNKADPKGAKADPKAAAKAKAIAAAKKKMAQQKKK